MRIGAVVKEKIKSSNPNIIDYATSGQRTDFLDVYLGANCHFFLCSDSGIGIVPELLRRPVVYVNWIQLDVLSTWTLHALVIPKKFYLKKEDRYLTFREIIGSELGTAMHAEIYEEHGVELIENTPEEIMAVVWQMEKQLAGTWKTTQEDEALQQQFWSVYGNHHLKSPNFRIGTMYLRKNRNLLE